MATEHKRRLSTLWTASREPYPPETARESEIALVVEFLKATLDQQGAVYISAPITTGRTFVDWLATLRHVETLSRDEFRAQHYDQVVSENVRRVRPLVDSFRRAFEGDVIDPTAVGVLPGWTQSDYRVAWRDIIRTFAHTVVLLDGWEYSSGCTYEFLVAVSSGINTLDQQQRSLSKARGLELIHRAVADFEAEGLSPDFIKAVYAELDSFGAAHGGRDTQPITVHEPGSGGAKDEVLDRLASHANVAQFVSFDRNAQQRFSRIIGYPANTKFSEVDDAVDALLALSPEKSVNVRSFDPAQPKGSEFVYGIRVAEEAVQHVRRLAAQGLFTIVNETVDVNDGGVSGVALGDVVEFAPGDTPRCVEKPGVATLSRRMGLRLIDLVYGFTPVLPLGPLRVEFSIHPVRRGHLAEHTIIWEIETVVDVKASAQIHWPNNFSRMIGDKTFGLLVADAIGLPVPRTTVVARSTAPFVFGRPTGTGEVWIRTAPREAVPGHFTTRRGWLDPYALLNAEDPQGNQLAAVLAQESVPSRYSGAAVTSQAGPVIEGVEGFGDQFMLGTKPPTQLPDDVLSAIRAAHERLQNEFAGPIKLEWAYDGERVWALQLQLLTAAAAFGRTIVPGTPMRVARFDVREGLEALRNLIGTLTPGVDGIVLEGDVGITSHFGDVLRRAGLASWLEYR